MDLHTPRHLFASESARVTQPSDGGDSRVVVAALDTSPSAAHAAYLAAGLARRSGATLVLVHVRRPPIVWPDLALAIGDVLETTAQPPREVTTLAVAISNEVGVEVELVVRAGSPAQEIARVAGERHADLVVAGTSTSFLHRLTHSVSRQLVRRRAWPVVTVP